MLQAIDHLLNLWKQVAALRIDRPDRLVVGLIIVQDTDNHPVFEIGQDVEIRKLANAKSGDAGLDHGLPAIAAKSAPWAMQLLVAALIEMPSCTGPDDTLMLGQIRYNMRRTSMCKITGRRAGEERARGYARRDQPGI